MCCAALPLPERGEEEGAGDGSAELHVNSRKWYTAMNKLAEEVLFSGRSDDANNVFFWLFHTSTRRSQCVT
jgi:hypothetical protein